MNGARYLAAVLVTVIMTWAATAETSRIIDPRHNAWGLPMVKILGRHILYIEPGDPFSDPPLPSTIFAMDADDMSVVSELEIPAGRPYDIAKVSEESIAIGLVHADARGAVGSGGVVIERPGSAQWSQNATVEKAGIVAIVRLSDQRLELRHQIRSPQPAGYASFGYSVAADDALLAVGEDGAAQLFRIDPANGTVSHFATVIHDPDEPVAVALSGDLLLSAGAVEICCGGQIAVHAIESETLTPLAQIDAPIHAQETNFGSTLRAVKGGFLIGGPGVNKGDDGGLQPGTLDYLTEPNSASASRFAVAVDLPAHAYGARHRICTSGDHVGALMGGHLVIVRLKDGTWSEVARHSIGTHGVVGFDCGGGRFVTVTHDRSSDARRWRVWTIAFDEIW